MQQDVVQRVLSYVTITGAIAVMMGAITVAGYAGQIAELDQISTSIATLTGRVLLVIVEVLLCAGWGLVACVGSTRARAYPYAVFVLVGKLLCSGGVFAANWSVFWYYMLDPNGGQSSVYLLLFFSVAQAVLLVVAVLIGSSEKPADETTDIADV